MDMSPAYRKGRREHLPNARTTFDRFPVVNLINEAVDQVRRAERKEAPELKRTRYLWLKNTSNLSQPQQRLLDQLLLDPTHLRTAKACQMKLAFQDFWDLPQAAKARARGYRSTRNLIAMIRRAPHPSTHLKQRGHPRTHVHNRG